MTFAAFPLPSNSPAASTPVAWVPEFVLPGHARTALPSRPAMSGVRQQTPSTTAVSARKYESFSAYADLLDQLADLLEQERTHGVPDGSPTTTRAIETAVSHLRAAQNRGVLMEGDSYPDGDGGLQIEWEHKERQVRLFLHAVDPREDYLYWQDGTARYAVEAPLSDSLLIGWLRWLRGDIK